MQSNDVSQSSTTWGHFAEPNAFRDPERLLSSFFGSSTVGFAICDEQLRYTAINKTLAELNGHPVQAHLGRTIREIIGEGAQHIEDLVRQVLLTGEPILNFELTFRSPARLREGRWINNLFPFKREDGKVVQVGAVVVETTRQQELEKELASLTSKLQAEKHRLRLLLDLDELLIAQPDLDLPQIFPTISDLLRPVLEHRYASLAFQDGETGPHICARDVSLLPAATDSTQLVDDIATIQRALQEVTVQCLDLHTIDTGPNDARGMLQRGLTCFCSVPLTGRNGTVGTINFATGEHHSAGFCESNLPFLKQVAGQITRVIDSARAYEEISDLTKKLRKETIYLHEAIKSELNFGELVGESPGLKRVLSQAEIVAPNDATALILGETGTGKELIARAIHRLSKRSTGSFIKLNCAAIPTGLLESELFGHEKGAFTGAVTQKIGRLELADQGTLFLDEVGDIPLEIQPKLLRVLQDQEFERLGGNRTIRVNVRLITATNRDLAKDVAAGHFRRDLYYRIHVFPLRLPALRERRQDIPLLVRHFVQRFATRMGKNIVNIPAETMNTLVNWDWPGNVRELENFIERSVILSTGQTLNVPLVELIQSSDGRPSGNTLEHMERDHIIRVLRETSGVIAGLNGAAARLGMKRTTLQSKMQRLGISRREFES